MAEIPNVTAGDVIEETWGDAVADAINDHAHTGGVGAGTVAVAHGDLASVTANQHHTQDHASRHQPGGADTMAVDAAAATGSLRTLGTGATQAAAGTHSHTGLPLDMGEAADIVPIGTAAAAGASGEIADASHVHKLLGPGIQAARASVGPITAGNNAQLTITWPTAFADANYSVSFSYEENTNLSKSVTVNVKSKAAGSVSINVANDTAASRTGTINAIAVHD